MVNKPGSAEKPASKEVQRVELQKQISNAVNKASHGRNIDMAFGTAHAILRSVDEGTDFHKKFVAPVIAAIEEFRDRISALSVNTPLKPSIISAPVSATDAVTREPTALESAEGILRDIRASHDADRNNIETIRRRLRAPLPDPTPKTTTAPAKYIKKRKFPESIHAWSAQEKLEFLAHAQEETAGEERIEDFLEMHGVSPAQYNFWLMNKATLQKTATEEIPAFPHHKNGETERDRHAPAHPRAESNGHAESDDESIVVIERNPLLPEKGFTGRWTDTERCVFIGMWNEAKGNPRMQKALQGEYGVPDSTLANWKKKFGTAEQVEGEIPDAAEASTATVPKAAPDDVMNVGREIRNPSGIRPLDTPAHTDYRTKDPSLPGPGHTEPWTDEQKLQLLELAGHIPADCKSGAKAAFGKLYGLQWNPTIAQWQCARKAILHRITLRKKKNNRMSVTVSTSSPLLPTEEAMITTIEGEGPCVTAPIEDENRIEASAKAPAELAAKAVKTHAVDEVVQDPQLPLPGTPTDDWTHEQRKILIVGVKAKKQRGYLAKVLAFYGIKPNTYHYWRTRLETSVSGIAESTSGSAEAVLQLPTATVSQEAHTPVAQATVTTSASTEIATAPTAQLEAVVLTEEMRRSLASSKPFVALDELSYLPEVIRKLSKDLGEPMLAAVAVMIQEMHGTIAARLGGEPTAHMLAAEIATVPPQPKIVAQEIVEPTAEAPAVAQQAAIAEVVKAIPEVTQAVVTFPSRAEPAETPVEDAPAVENEADKAETERRDAFVRYIAVNYRKEVQTYEEAYEIATRQCIGFMTRALEMRSINRHSDASLFDSLYPQVLAALLARFHASKDGSLRTFIQNNASAEIDTLHSPAVRGEEMQSPQQANTPPTARTKQGASMVNAAEKSFEAERYRTVKAWADQNRMFNVTSLDRFYYILEKINAWWLCALSEKIARQNKNLGTLTQIRDRGFAAFKKFIHDHPFDDSITKDTLQAQAEPMAQHAMLHRT